MSNFTYIKTKKITHMHPISIPNVFDFNSYLLVISVTLWSNSTIEKYIVNVSSGQIISVVIKGKYKDKPAIHANDNIDPATILNVLNIHVCRNNNHNFNILSLMFLFVFITINISN